jgi:para-nitrobenzyl esterase
MSSMQESRGALWRAFLWSGAAAALLACGQAESPGDTASAVVAAEQDVAAAPTSREVPAEPVAEVQSGKLRGAYQNGTYSFKGVPYGASTTGANRFRAPQAITPWTDVRDATQFGSICPQTGVVAEGRPESSPYGGIPKLEMGEDCLRLNVWTPALDSAARPVMVWLHGRGFREGAGSEPMYDGTALARDGDVVVVSINHRLNIFGYLHLAGLGGESFAGSGVAGMLDAVAALEWVRDNIGTFGGDPTRVTIFGESGGGAKVSTLLAMPSAKGLIHRAAIQSGPGLRGVEAEAATETAKRILAALEIDPATPERIREVPTEALLAAMESLDAEAAQAFRPVVDGQYLPAHPFDPVAAASAAGIPVIVGSNKDEAALFLIADPKRGTLTEEELRTRVSAMLGDRADAVLDVYRKTRPGATPWDLLVAVATERTRLGSLVLADRQAATGAPVYVYLFDWETNVAGGFLKAMHGLEIPFVFNHPDSVPFTGTAPGQPELAKAMSQAWAAFARTGSPSHPGMPEWKPYTPENGNTMIFDNEIRLEQDPRKDERLAWEGIGPVRF